MKKPLTLTLILCLSLTSLAFSAELSGSSTSAALGAGLRQWARGGKVDLGFYAQDLKTGDILVDVDGVNPLSPASSIKILTAAAAFEILKPWGKFPLKVEKITGGLKITGGGDPTLVTEDLFMLAREIARKIPKGYPVETIAWDATVFDAEPFSETRLDLPPEEADRAYNAPVSGLNFNYNAITAWILPGPGPKTPAVIRLDPESDVFEVRNNLVTGKGGYRGDFRTSEKNGKEIISIQGNIPSGLSEQHRYFRVENPPRYFAATLCDFLRKEGIRAPCKTLRPAKASDSGTQILVSDMKTVGGAITLMNIYSNNFIAEALAKKISAESGTSAGTLKNGVEKIRKFALEKVGISSKEITLWSPSGLSTGNRISTKGLVQVLEHVLSSPYAVDFEASLPRGGVDGTLKKRFSDLREPWRIRGKSGYINGAASFAGIYQTPSGRKILFSLIANRGRDSDLSVKGLDPRIGAWLESLE